VSCPRTDELLLLLDDAHDGPRRHVDGCPACAAALADLGRVRLLGRRQPLRGLLDADPVVAAAVRRTLRRRRVRRVQQALSVAAGLLLVAVLGVEPVLRVRVELPPERSAAAPVGSALWGAQEGLAYLR
jgi:hypothetical protein